jgi:hypothetical protein
VATIQVPGAGLGPHDGKHGRRAPIIVAVALACAAIVLPFALHALHTSGAQAPAATRVAAPSQGAAPVHRHPVSDPQVGRRGGLPALLPVRSRLTDGTHVRLGDLTAGVLRRTSAGGWRVLVRWDGKVQPAPVRGPVQLGGPSGQRSTSWVSAEGLLYTRIRIGTGQFRVYAWDPRDATAYTPPTLVATDLGRVCFNASFTAFGDCRTAG